MNISASSINEDTLGQWLLNISWTSDLATQWQTFYNTASQLTAFGRAGYYNISFMASLPTYNDLNTVQCVNQQTNNSVTVTTGITTMINTTTMTSISNNLITHQSTFFLLLFISSLMTEIMI